MQEGSSRSTGQACFDLWTCETPEPTISPAASSSAVASRAPTSPQQETAQGSTAPSPLSGESSPASFASFDRATSSWRTPAPSPPGASLPFLGTWPRAGMMRSGTAFQLAPLVPPTFGRGALWLPTPRATDGERGGRGDLLAVLKGRPQHGYKAHPVFSGDPSNLPPGGHTNPDFTDWLMGLPPGWTSAD
jgi:hypothetical protein